MFCVVCGPQPWPTPHGVSPVDRLKKKRPPPPGNLISPRGVGFQKKKHLLLGGISKQLTVHACANQSYSASARKTRAAAAGHPISCRACRHGPHTRALWHHPVYAMLPFPPWGLRGQPLGRVSGGSPPFLSLKGRGQGQGKADGGAAEVGGVRQHRDRSKQVQHENNDGGRHPVWSEGHQTMKLDRRPLLFLFTSATRKTVRPTSVCYNTSNDVSSSTTHWDT